jgi:drug/metabolite transporter (DMT)-like permease
MIYAIFTCFAWGIAYYLSAKISKAGISYSGFAFFYLPISIFVVGYGLLSGVIKQDLKLLVSLDWKIIVVYLFSSLIGNFCVYMAFKTTSPFLVATIELGYPIVILAILILRKETNWNWTQLLGTAIVIFGMILVLKESGKEIVE